MFTIFHICNIFRVRRAVDKEVLGGLQTPICQQRRLRSLVVSKNFSGKTYRIGALAEKLKKGGRGYYHSADSA